MDIKALQLAARFALPPNSLGYCGKDSAPEKFKKCIITGESKGIEKELEKFIVMHPYLATLGKLLGQNKFSYKVVEAYCLGNHELERVTPEDYAILLDEFSKQGVPDWLVEELRGDIPKRFIPFHLFQVLHVGVGRASGSVPFNLESINNCMVRWGKVAKVDSKNNILTAELWSLTYAGSAKRLTKNQEKKPFVPEMLPGVTVGDTVAVHWQQAIKTLSETEEKNLSYWTQAVLENAK